MSRLKHPPPTKDKLGLCLATFSSEQFHDTPHNQCNKRLGPKINAKKLALPQRCSPGRGLSRKWRTCLRAGHRELGCTRSPEGGVRSACSRHGQHAGPHGWKMLLTPERHLHLRASNTATPRISAKRLQIAESPPGAKAPGTASGRLQRAGPWPRRVPGSSRLPRCEEPGWPGSAVRESRGQARADGHYLSDGVSEEQDARPAQEPPAGSRLRQRHGRGRTSAGSLAASSAAGNGADRGKAPVTHRVQVRVPAPFNLSSAL